MKSNNHQITFPPSILRNSPLKENAYTKGRERLNLKSNKHQMKINAFIEKFTVNPITDIEPHFKLTKEVDVDAIHHKGCFNCDDKLNQHQLKSSAWTGVQYCWACNHLNVIYYQDRLGGSYTDTIKCFTEK